jgi:hypothetical protein
VEWHPAAMAMLTVLALYLLLGSPHFHPNLSFKTESDGDTAAILRVTSDHIRPDYFILRGNNGKNEM